MELKGVKGLAGFSEAAPWVCFLGFYFTCLVLGL